MSNAKSTSNANKHYRNVSTHCNHLFDSLLPHAHAFWIFVCFKKQIICFQNKFIAV